MSSEQDKKNENTSQTIQLVVFSVGREQYGVEIEKVQEVIRMGTIKKLPRSPNFVLGVMNLRGNIIPIIGLREKFGMESRDYNEFTRIIVVNNNGKLAGMVVDEVNRVIQVSVENIEQNPEMVSHETKTLVKGIARYGEEVIILVELDYLVYSVEEVHSETFSSNP
ncbi:MAG: chemotaxis protein CheW [Leptospiraceae bacterium]|nr:chemotaxis protein CheW [Leptospiraceae bacterium]MDW8306244.1 chemotaxis protein CheW [Leptospiraceae bacterium]